MQERKVAIVISCIIGLLLLASIVSYIVMQRTADKNGSSSYVRIMQNGKCIEEIDLSKVTESYEILLKNPSGGTNVVEVRPDCVGVVEADCPDKLCKKQGFIEDGSKTIVCLPNRLVVEFVQKTGKDDQDELDVVAQ